MQLTANRVESKSTQWWDNLPPPILRLVVNNVFVATLYQYARQNNLTYQEFLEITVSALAAYSSEMANRELRRMQMDLLT